MSDQPLDTGRQDGPQPGLPPALAADELFTHGLLGFLHQDHAAVQAGRVERVLGELDEGRAVVYKFRGVRALGRWGAVAAAAAMVTAAAILGVPGQASAQATLQRSIEAMRAGGDRRYELRSINSDESALSKSARGVVDTRSPNLLLMRIQDPAGRAVTVGRDRRGKWVLRRDGRIDRDEVEPAWPRFATVGDESLFADSVDSLLDQMTRRYELSRQAAEKLPGHGDAALDHIRATKKTGGNPGINQIDVWISPATKVVEKIELRFDEARGPGADGPNGPDGPPPGGGEGHPGRMRPRHGGGGPDGQGPMGGPPGRDGPDGDDDQGDRPPSPPPHGADGMRPPLPPPPPPGGPDAEGHGGPGGGRPRPLPPKLIVLERVEAPNFAADWFTPGAHVERP